MSLKAIVCLSQLWGVYLVCIFYSVTWFATLTLVPFCALHGIMGGGKDLTEDQIAAITSLSLVGKSNKEISIISGVALRSVQR